VTRTIPARVLVLISVPMWDRAGALRRATVQLSTLIPYRSRFVSLPIDELIIAGQKALAGGFPKAAVVIARELLDRSAPSLIRDINVASLLIDAGSDLRAMNLVREGVALLDVALQPELHFRVS